MLVREGHFPVDAEMTSIVVAYRNHTLIADDVLPRLPPMTKKQYTYEEYDLADGFTLPWTKVGRLSYPEQVHFNSKEVERKCEDYGLEDVIPVDDIDNTPNGKSLMNRRVEFLTDLILLDREVRVAQMIQSPDTYLPSNVFSPALPWTDPDADPIGDVSTAMGAMLFRPNTLTFGSALFDIFARHPKVVMACNRNDGAHGIARIRDIAELFRVDKVLVGEALVNIMRKSHDPELKLAWGKSLSLSYLDKLGGPGGKPSFGFTAQYGTRVAGKKEDPRMGLRGGFYVRAGETVDEAISCKALGALIQHP